ncbi:MAG: GNAT family N-acetyltransferase [Spirochaetaceae bacterium]
MELLNQIIKAEFSYKKLTSKKESKSSFINFHDKTTPNVPLQNFTFIKRLITLDELRRTVESEKKRVIKENKSFIRFVFDPYAPFSGEVSELSDFTFYCHQVLTLDLNSINESYAEENCTVVHKEHRKQLEKLYDSLNSDIEGGDIHSKRWIDLKFRNKNITTLVYKQDADFIGDCELFYVKNIVKLDDLEVLKDCRNRGVGEALLKSAISVAKASGKETLYLIADRDDWITDYYLSLGFELFAEYNSCILYS